MADRFYTPDLLSPGEFILTGAEAHHLSAVRRFECGDQVILFNGDGNEYPAEILSTGKKSVALQILRVEPVDRELPLQLVVAAALPKADRADYLIEKLTELGTSRFIPLITARAIVRPKESVTEKFSRAVIEASKQCGRNRLMAIDPVRTWSELLALGDLPQARLVLHTGKGLHPLKDRGEVAIAIGPEGGFTLEELQLAATVGWQCVSLGPRVLRIETAAVTAAAILSAAH